MRFLKETLKNLPWLAGLFRERDKLREEGRKLREEVYRLEHIIEGLQSTLNQPPEHFYSPVVSPAEIRQYEWALFDANVEEIAGIDLNDEGQLELMEKFQRFYDELPFPDQKSESFRYHLDNPNFAYSDGIYLYCLIRHLKPRRIIEIGSGFSSCVMLDTNRLFSENSIRCTFIEPFPKLLRRLLRPEDESKVEILAMRLQAVDLNIFRSLSAGDILFIDSTHVAKANSDVNWIFFRILPLLNSGVYIHFHDIFYPFEYTREWLYEGRSWNEAYMLRAFLQNNRAFRVRLFRHYLKRFHSDLIQPRMPLCLANVPGSLWIEKTEAPAEKEIAAITGRKIPPIPDRIEVGALTHPRQLGEGWYDQEGEARWMQLRAGARLRGPGNGDQRLWIAAWNPSYGMEFTVSAEGLSVGKYSMKEPGHFQCSFALPPSLLNKSEFALLMEVHPQYQPPGDSRELGLCFGIIEIR